MKLNPSSANTELCNHDFGFTFLTLICKVRMTPPTPTSESCEHWMRFMLHNSKRNFYSRVLKMQYFSRERVPLGQMGDFFPVMLSELWYVSFYPSKMCQEQRNLTLKISRSVSWQRKELTNTQAHVVGGSAQCPLRSDDIVYSIKEWISLTTPCPSAPMRVLDILIQSVEPWQKVNRRDLLCNRCLFTPVNFLLYLGSWGILIDISTTPSTIAVIVIHASTGVPYCK